MSKGVFLTVKDLMLLNGTDSYNSAQREHASIRSALEKDNIAMKRRLGGRLKYTKRRITIREYCDYMQLEFSEVWGILRGKIQGENDL